MNANWRWTNALLIAAAVSCTPGQDEGGTEAETESELHASYEVWLVDQSNSASGFGGKIYVYGGWDLVSRDPSSAAPIDVIDLAATTSELCMSATGANPVRPHMLLFNANHTHAVLSFVASGHVVIFEAASRRPLACIRTSAGAGGARQAHAAFPSPGGTYILIANQNGKLLERIDTDYRKGTFTLNPEATLDLANCVTPNGVPCQLTGVRPDNAPICPVIDSTGYLAFVTLRGGGLFVVDPTTEPMSIVAEYDSDTINGNGCGGIEARGAMFIDSGGGTAANLTQFDVYGFPLWGYDPANPPNVPEPAVLFTDNEATFDRDAHGMTRARYTPYLWVLDRAANAAEIIDVDWGEHVNTIDLTSSFATDPTPDLADVSPDGTRLFISTRGPNPLTGDPHVATGSTPGLMIVRLRYEGYTGDVRGLARITNVDAMGVERADAHAVRVRRLY